MVQQKTRKSKITTNKRKATEILGSVGIQIFSSALLPLLKSKQHKHAYHVPDSTLTHRHNPMRSALPLHTQERCGRAG